MKQDPVEEMIILLEKKNKQIQESITKMEHDEISKWLNNSIVPKFIIKNGSK